ncbi:MAG: hypothetical protein GXY14_02440 [Spirochaetes bacterium]|jgi:hypothetical protein|nr:hypothetical protein [Spirochaetota bacterium]
MLPIVDYGSIAIVVPHVTAVGSTVTEDDKPGFEVFLTGMEDPVIIGFDTEDEATEARNELIAIIAQYHYTRELGPDFDINDLMNDKDDEGINEH